MPAGMGGMPPSLKRASERHSSTSLALALHDVEIEAGLLVGVGGEGLRRAAGDRRVAVDELLDDAAHRLEAERQRHHVEQQHVVACARAAGEDVGLHGRAQRDDLVGIDVGERLAAEELATKRRTSGMRVAPPTRMTPDERGRLEPASLSARRTGGAQRSSTRRDERLQLRRASGAPSRCAVRRGELDRASVASVSAP